MSYEFKTIAQTVDRTRVDTDAAILLHAINQVDTWKLEEDTRPVSLNGPQRDAKSPPLEEQTMPVCLHRTTEDALASVHLYPRHLMPYKCPRCIKDCFASNGQLLAFKLDDPRLLIGSFATEQELIDHKRTCLPVNFAIPLLPPTRDVSPLAPSMGEASTSGETPYVSPFAPSAGESSRSRSDASNPAEPGRARADIPQRAIIYVYPSGL